MNYAAHIGESKGLIGEARIAGKPVNGWTVGTIDIEAVACAAARSDVIDARQTMPRETHAGPIAMRGEFELDGPSDLFLDTHGWGRGYALVNGFLLGRYWANGPQSTLFVPAPVTRTGRNLVVFLELEGVATRAARFLPRPSLGPTEE